VALIINVDGGARGNPGPAGAGVVITTSEGTRIHEAGYFLGRQTNNAAEYHALIRALQRAQQCGQQPLSIHSDSELLVRQITGDYRVKSPRLAQLYEQVQLLLLRAGVWNIQHVPREENARADALANLAMDRQQDVIVFDRGAGAPQSADDGSSQPPDLAETEEPSGVAEHDYPRDAATQRAVRVVVARPPDEEDCPAGGLPFDSCTIGAALPEGLCVHAAHALLPTILAVQNTLPADFSRMPTLTVRCTRRSCRAEFHVTPHRGSNGVPKRS
jgi:ribonuclease HI